MTFGEKKNISTNDLYYDEFKGTKEPEAYKSALQEAQENRRFEIDNYWKRAAYFWAFIAAVYTAYFHVLTDIFNNEHGYFVLVVLGVLGFFFSLAWYLVNKASKYWQENWEYHQMLLEEKVYGSLYSLSVDQKSFSVSKVNLFLSLLCTICSAFLAGYELVLFIKRRFASPSDQWLFFLCGVLFLFLLTVFFILYSRSGSTQEKYISFKKVWCE